MSREVEINDSFFTQLGNDPAIVALCDAAAQRIAGIARANAHKDSHDYANSIHVEHGSRAGRHASLVVADDPKALLMEAKYGTLIRATIEASK